MYKIKSLYDNKLDALFFASDVVIAISKPSMYLPINSFYGPASYELRVTSDLMVWHMLKNRVGEPDKKLIMKTDFARMQVIDPSNPITTPSPQIIIPSSTGTFKIRS